MTLLEVKYRKTDVSGGVRTPPLIQIMHTYVCTHGHRTRHDPLHWPVGTESTHDIAHAHRGVSPRGWTIAWSGRSR